uniref:Placenta associated 8 n=1 Tax=Geospiza parvula TaxID=87175 RepID=A0A8C3M8Y7_GEOPR
MAVPTVVTIQPQFGGAMSSVSRCTWQTGLMDCCSDCGVCCCGMFCFPCLACQVAGDMNECCLCGTSVAMRTLYRTRYNIPVSAEPAPSPCCCEPERQVVPEAPLSALEGGLRTAVIATSPFFPIRTHLSCCFRL